jgi:hypothetical protein
MADYKQLKDLVLRRAKDTDFDVETGDFSKLVIEPAEGFHYFYDSAERRLIKSFVLRNGPQVDTMCDVILVPKDERFTARLRFWKRDKTKGNFGKAAADAIAAGDAAILVKASVDLDDCHENFWKLIAFLRSCGEVELPSHDFRVAPAADVELLDALTGHDKQEVLSAVKTYLGGDITEHDVQMLVDRRQTLERFERLLADPEFFEAERARVGLNRVEDAWQALFEENPWIFGYGLSLVSCEQFTEAGLEARTSGNNVFTGAGKRVDAVMRTRGFVQSLLFGEIKRHDTDLLADAPYRPPDTYRPSIEMAGAVAQVQKAVHKAMRKLEDLHRQHSPDGTFDFEVSTIKPKQVVVIGNLAQLVDGDAINIEKMNSFELYRRTQQDVEILTFDELLERTRFIVQSGEMGLVEPTT